MQLFRAALISLVLLLPVSGFSWWEEALDWQEVERQARRALEMLDLDVNLPPPGQLAMLLEQTERIIREGTIEDFARFAPMARGVHAMLRQDERFAPVMDWFAQRLDYFEFAEHLFAPPPPPAAAPGRPAPAPAPAPRPPPRQRMDDPAAWRNRAQQLPPPRGAGQWVPRLKPIFAEEGLPPELVWLAEVESSFNPQARSPVGAKGLFQFMPATAESLGLRIAPEDERTHPEKSARAAAQYLRTLYGRFGDWPLVLAAYNAGQGRVAGLTRRHGDSFEAISAFLPAETRMYVPKVLGVIAEREGIDPRRMPSPQAR